jgi:hypothetical protein
MTMNDDRNHDDAIVALCIAGLIVLPLLIAVLIAVAIVRGIWHQRQRRQDQRILDRAVARTAAWDAHEADARARLCAFLLKAERRR